MRNLKNAIEGELSAFFNILRPEIHHKYISSQDILTGYEMNAEDSFAIALIHARTILVGFSLRNI